MKDTIEGRISGEQIDLYTTEISNPGVLDMLWASFFATGDVLPIQRIISVLHLRKDGHGEEIIVGGAAEWSLRSNVTQHPKVLWICKQELTKSEGLTKTLLEDVLKPTPK